MTSRTDERPWTGAKPVWGYPKCWVICCIALAMSAAIGGTVEQAAIYADPQMQVKGGTVNACGYRLKAIPKSFDGKSPVLVFDASFILYLDGVGLLKGGARYAEFKDGKPHPITKQIQRFWMKAHGEKPTNSMNGKVAPSVTQGYVLYEVPVDTVLKLFVGVLKEEPFTLGVQLEGEGVDRIYSGAVQMSETDRKQGGQCLDDLLREIEAASPISRPGG